MVSCRWTFHFTADNRKFPTDFLDNDSPALEVYDLSHQDNRTVPAAMCFSSGTSGSPKGVLISHHNLIAYCLTARSSSPTITNVHTTEVFFPSCTSRLRCYRLANAVLIRYSRAHLRHCHWHSEPGVLRQPSRSHEDVRLHLVSA